MAPHPNLLRGFEAPTSPGGDIAVIHKLVQAMVDAVVVVGADDRVVALNPPALALLPKLRRNAVLATHLRSPDVLDAIASARRSGQDEKASWLERVPVERLFEVSASPVEGLACGPVVVVTLHEISEARRVERMRVDFIANASHELRTPLASLLGFIETMQGPARNDAKVQGRFLDIMRDQAQRMARLVDDLLSLSRIEQHLHLRPQTPVDLAIVLRHITDTLSPLARETDTQMVLALCGPLVVSGDRDELMRVAENLIENAIKYGASDAQDRRVEIELRKEGREAVVAITDHGPGIAAEHIPRLTERFYRVDTNQSRAKGGTGLGLALVKHVVARHRGRLSIESTPGVGATFAVYLPLRQE